MEMIYFIEFWLPGFQTCGLYIKPITIVTEDSSTINKLETSLIGDAIIVIYDHHMFIVQATELFIILRVLLKGCPGGGTNLDI